jgi:tRNA-splicing ligase RtcB
MMVLAEQALTRVLGGNRASLGFRLVYDLAHNIAKLEEHESCGSARSCWSTARVRRGHFRPDTGSPRPLPGGRQPVLVPGDMGRPSYVCIGAEGDARNVWLRRSRRGRMLSRTARKRSAGRNVARELADRGILVAARSNKTLAEEMSEAYKDAGQVVAALELAGIARAVARLRPLGVVKG